MSGCNTKNVTTNNSSGNKNNSENKVIPKVYVYNNSGVLQAGVTSKPEKLESIKKIIMDATGVEPVVIVPPTDSNEAKTKLNLLISSGEPLDLFWGNWQDYASMGMISPVNELLNQQGKDIKKKLTGDTWVCSTDKDGKIWGIPRFFNTVAYPVWIRADWLKKLNIPIPKTLDELENTLIALKEADPAGSGSTITMLADMKGLSNCFLGAFTEYGNSNFKDADGKIKPVQLIPEYKEFLTRMHDWYQKGLIAKEAFTYKTTQNVEYIKQNKVAATALWYSRVTLNHGTLKKNFPEAEYEIAYLTGPKGKAETVTPAANTSLLFSAKSKNLDAAMKLINWYYQKTENYIIGCTGKKGVDWNYTDEANYIYSTNPSTEDYADELNFAAGTGNVENSAHFDPDAVKHTNYMGLKYIPTWTGQRSHLTLVSTMTRKVLIRQSPPTPI